MIALVCNVGSFSQHLEVGASYVHNSGTFHVLKEVAGTLEGLVELSKHKNWQKKKKSTYFEVVSDVSFYSSHFNHIRHCDK